MYLKNKKQKHKRKIIIILILIIIASIASIQLTINIEKYYIKSAKEIIEKKTIDIINNSISNDMLDKIYEDKLISIKKNNNNEIETIEYNNHVINKFTNELTSILENELEKNIHQEIKIPITSVFNNTILNSISPKIKVKTNTVSSVIANIDLEAKEYGINNVIIEIYLTTIIKRNVTLPFVSEEICVEMNNPISYVAVNGKIPQYYTNKNDLPNDN